MSTAQPRSQAGSGHLHFNGYLSSHFSQVYTITAGNDHACSRDAQCAQGAYYHPAITCRRSQYQESRSFARANVLPPSQRQSRHCQFPAPQITSAAAANIVAAAALRIKPAGSHRAGPTAATNHSAATRGVHTVTQVVTSVDTSTSCLAPSGSLPITGTSNEPRPTGPVSKPLYVCSCFTPSAGDST